MGAGLVRFGTIVTATMPLTQIDELGETEAIGRLVSVVEHLGTSARMRLRRAWGACVGRGWDSCVPARGPTPRRPRCAGSSAQNLNTNNVIAGKTTSSATRIRSLATNGQTPA